MSDFWRDLFRRRCNAIVGIHTVTPTDPGTVAWSLAPYTEVTICKRRRWHFGNCGAGNGSNPPPEA